MVKLFLENKNCADGLKLVGGGFYSGPVWPIAVICENSKRKIALGPRQTNGPAADAARGRGARALPPRPRPQRGPGPGKQAWAALPPAGLSEA
jgi:hypothetical protein